MEVIQDELQKNGVNVDIETLTEHIEYILNNYKDAYSQGVRGLNRFPLNVDMFQKVFKEINVNSLGRAMAYLTLIYRVSHDGRRYRTSSCSFSCTRDKKYGKSRREFYTRTLFVGSFVGIELMGFVIVCK